MERPSFREEYISQIPALQLLMKMGWKYLSPEQALEARGGRTSNVLLEEIMKAQLGLINRIHYKEKEYEFSPENINAAILALRNLPVQEGFITANQVMYDLITLGKDLEQSIQGDKKSYTLKYIDWEHPERNVYHVTEEFSVLRHGRSDAYRPDLVLFINGIPFVVIECKSPKVGNKQKSAVEQAIEQHLRNQNEDGIRALYQYSSMLISIASNDAKYATTATEKEFWSFWKEMHVNQTAQKAYLKQVEKLKNSPLEQTSQNELFKDRFYSVLKYFAELDAGEKKVTVQDEALYNLCQPARLLDLVRNFTVYDDGIKKIARYQQYFSVHNTLERIQQIGVNGKRKGGVIWHTQGSGKSLTMVMLAQLIAKHPKIRNPRIVLVTDRIDLDDQITETFKKCDLPVRQAKTGASREIKKKLSGQALKEEELARLRTDTSLLGLLDSPDDHIITTIINKFEAAVKSAPAPFESPDIFVLVDEGHRSQYGTFNVKMQKVFPNACFLAFTGTPLMKKEKNTAGKFGGMIDVYSIKDAVADGAVVPLLYEGRHNLFSVNEKPLDTYFDKVSEPLTDYGKASLKRKFSTKSVLNKADQVVYERAFDLSEHFDQHIRNPELRFKGQLVTPNKITAIRYKKYLDEIGKVSSEVLISAPDQREGTETAYAGPHDEVLRFWKQLMDEHGNIKKYEKNLINRFKKGDHPEIIIVVDKLLTGFDAPCNVVLYLTRHLKDHTLLQAVARVNRLYPGKEYGLIIDYYGNLENLDSALNIYSGLEGFDQEELQGTLTRITEEIDKLPQAHSVVWDLFKAIRNKYDEEAYEELLSDESIRHDFYEKLSAFSRLLKLALASYEWTTHTPEEKIDKYKKDLKFFLGLRISVKRRYSDDIDFKEFESQIQQLVDKHITTEGEVLKITELVNIFDDAAREKEVEKFTSKAAKADHIASRTIRAINIKMDEDPVFYKKLAQLIKEAIQAYHQERISEAEFLKKASEYEETFLKGQQVNLPLELKDKEIAIAFYNLTHSVLSNLNAEDKKEREIASDIALTIDNVIQEHVFLNGQPIVDWQKNLDIEGRLKIAIDDSMFDFQNKYAIEFDLGEVDDLIEEVLKVAKLRYK